jgi:hypothetical protein
VGAGGRDGPPITARPGGNAGGESNQKPFGAVTVIYSSSALPAALSGLAGFGSPDLPTT